MSREEWMVFSQRRFAGATEASGGEMTSQDYQSWLESGMCR